MAAVPVGIHSDLERVSRLRRTDTVKNGYAERPPLP
jgi:hypothetical protein